MKTMAVDAMQLLAEQRERARRATWSFFDGELSKMRWRRVLAPTENLMVMCFAPLPDMSDGDTARVGIGGGCRLAKLGEEWASAKTEAEADEAAAISHAAVAEAAKTGSVPTLFPSLPWGEIHPFSEDDLGRCEVERVSNDQVLVCFEKGSPAMISCRLAFLGADLEFGPELHAGPGRLASVAATNGGRGFGVCIQAATTASGSVSCRWGEVSAGEGNMRWTEDQAMEFVFE